MRKKTLKNAYQNLDKNLLCQESLSILELYLVEDSSLEQIIKQFNYSQSEVRHKIAKAIYELKKLSNDPEYVKARAILYGDQKIML